jgi:hypothetical protein
MKRLMDAWVECMADRHMVTDERRNCRMLLAIPLIAGIPKGDLLAAF